MSIIAFFVGIILGLTGAVGVLVGFVTLLTSPLLVVGWMQSVEEWWLIVRGWPVMVALTMVCGYVAHQCLLWGNAHPYAISSGAIVAIIGLLALEANDRF